MFCLHSIPKHFQNVSHLKLVLREIKNHLDVPISNELCTRTLIRVWLVRLMNVFFVVFLSYFLSFARNFVILNHDDAMRAERTRGTRKMH